MRKRLIAILLIIVLMLSTVPVSAADPDTDFDNFVIDLVHSTDNSTLVLTSNIYILMSMDLSDGTWINPGLTNLTIDTNGYSIILDGEMAASDLNFVIPSCMTITSTVGATPTIVVGSPMASGYNSTLTVNGTVTNHSGAPTVLVSDGNVIVNKTINGGGVGVIIKKGALTVNAGGLVTGNTGVASDANATGVNVQLNGGEINGASAGVSMSAESAQFTMNSGTVIGNPAIAAYNGGDVTVIGGTISNDDDCDAVIDISSDIYTSTVNLTGCTINATKATSDDTKDVVGIRVDGLLSRLNSAPDVTINVTDGSDGVNVNLTGIELTDSISSYIYSVINLTANNGTNKAITGIKATDSDLQLYSGALINAGSVGTGISLISDSSCSLRTGAAINGNTGVKVTEDATLSMTGGTISASGELPVGILLASSAGITDALAYIDAGSIAVNDTNAVGAGAVIHSDGIASTAYIHGGTFNLAGFSEVAADTGAVFKATNDGSIQIQDNGSLNANIQINLTTDHNSSVLLADGGTITVPDAPNAATIGAFDVLKYAIIRAGGLISLSETAPVASGSKQVWVESAETNTSGEGIAFLNTDVGADIDVVLYNTGSKATIGPHTFTGVATTYDVTGGATLGEITGILPSVSTSGTFWDINWDTTAVNTSISGQYTAYGTFPDYVLTGAVPQLSLRTEVIVGDYPTLTGTVLIYGDSIFGEELTAVIPDSNAAFDEFTYQWYRWNYSTSQWDAIGGATSSSYTLVAADVGTTHSVLVGASEKTGTIQGLSVIDAVKAQNTNVPGAPTFISKTATEVIVGSGAYNYRFVGGEWQSTNAFSGLMPNTTYEFQVRFMETATKYASEPSAILEVTTNNLPPLQGIVGIDGQFIYGQTLTAVTTGITSTAPGTLSYQWFLLDPVTYDTFPIGTNSPTYTITAGNVGKGIALAVGAANYSGSVNTGEAYIVAKAVGPTPGPIAPIVGKRTIELPYVENTFEYSLIGTTWQDAKVFSGLIPNTEYTVRARSKETATHSVSAVVDMLVTTDNLDTPTIPNAPTVLEKTATSISLVTIPGNVYTINNGATMNTHGVFTLLNPNTEYSFKQRVESTADSFESDWSDAALITTNPKAVQDAPSAPVLNSKTYNTITLAELGSAKVALKSIGGVVVADEDLVFGTLPVFADLQPNTTYGFVTRLDATDSLLVSPLSTVTEMTTDSLGVPSAPNAPTVATKTTTSITLSSVAGCEYKLGDGEWQDGTVFSGLIEGAEYTFYQRLKATPGFVVSETSAPLIARTVESALITAFSFNTLTPNVTGVVNEGAKTISLTVPYRTDVTALAPTITHTGASVSPGNNVARNFTSPVTYTVIAADTTTTTYTVTVTRAASSSGGSSSGNSSTPTSVPQPSQGAVIVIVNGEAQNAGTETRTTENGTTTVTVEVDNRVIESKMEEAMAGNPAGTGNYIQVPITDTSAQAVNVALTGDMVKKLEESRFDVSVKRDDVEYIIPAEEINIGKVAETLGVARTNLANIQVEVRMTRLDEGVIKKYNEVTKANGAELIFPPVSFSVVAKTTKADGSTEEVGINTFSNYVERVMELPAGMDPSQVTTGIVFNADGTYSHVPTTVFQKDGKWYASLRSLTNSAYSVIWHPVTVASVANHWSRDAVNDMASRLVIKDPETFIPNQNITRGEFAEYITKALGLYRTGMAYTQTFSDVTGMPDLTAAIEIASAYGIIKGYPDDSFKPNAQISREEAMVMYARAMDVAGLEEVDNNRISQYIDLDMIASWAFHDVKKTVSAGVFNGKSTETINPKDTFSKAEAATAIRNLLVASGLINQ